MRSCERRAKNWFVPNARLTTVGVLSGTAWTPMAVARPSVKKRSSRWQVAQAMGSLVPACTWLTPAAFVDSTGERNSCSPTETRPRKAASCPAWTKGRKAAGTRRSSGRTKRGKPSPCRLKRRGLVTLK